MKSERKGNQMKKAITALMVFTICISIVSCSQSSKYSLSDIKLTESVRSWSNPEEEYSELVKLYGDLTCTGTLAVATDKDIIYLYAENAVEKDGVTLESQDTVFDMASVSKTFTAVSVLQLAEKGKLNLEDTLDAYFPEYEAGKKITIDNLLHMNSGIPDYCNNPDKFWNISGEDAANQKLSDIYLDKITDEEFMQALYKAPLVFEPGTGFEYSNTNYHLLAFIIEKASGMKYCDYVKKNIFDKCGMTKTSSMAIGDMTYVPVGFDELVCYGFTDKDGYPAGPNNYRGDSGIHSCLTDMVAFDRALFAGKLLSKSSMEILLENVNGYCSGLMKEKDGYSHSGSSFTCMTNNRIIESEDYGHIYIIMFERTGVVSGSNWDDPLEGTNYTQSVVNDGIFINEYAELKIRAPHDFTILDEGELKSMWDDVLRSLNDNKEKTRKLATKSDACFWCRKTGESINVYFLNTKLGFPYDNDYTEEDYLNDEIKTYEEYEIIEKNINKVTLGGKEYTKAELLVDFNGMECRIYIYVRKIDENLMVKIDAASLSDKRADYFEDLFLET